MSDDGNHAITLIAFVGSVFSPYYAWARRRGAADPENHCALNVALYGNGGKRWALTERGRGALMRGEHELGVGPSRLLWENGALVIDIDEMTVPFPSRIKGRVRLVPQTSVTESFELDADGLHRWQPIAPLARVEVAFDKPGLSWSGSGYLDTNWGAVPLETSFERWDWSRSCEGKRARILYDVTRRGASDMVLSLEIKDDGSVQRAGVPARARLPSTLVWRIPRGTRAEGREGARVCRTLEDTPFYARSLIETRLGGKTTRMVHESLSLDRFKMPIVQAMLPFRMPRRRG